MMVLLILVLLVLVMSNTISQYLFSFNSHIKTRKSFINNKENYRLHPIDLTSQVIQYGIDPILNLWLKKTKHMIDGWVQRSSMPGNYNLQPFYIFYAEPINLEQLTGTIKSYFSCQSPSLIFLTQNPTSENIASKFYLYHEMGHLGYRRSNRIASILPVIVNLVIILYLTVFGYLSGYSFYGSFILIFTILIRWLLKVREFEEELIADWHSISSLYLSGETYDNIMKIYEMFNRNTDSLLRKGRVIPALLNHIRFHHFKIIASKKKSVQAPAYLTRFGVFKTIILISSGIIGYNFELLSWTPIFLILAVILLLMFLYYFALGAFTSTYDILVRDIIKNV